MIKRGVLLIGLWLFFGLQIQAFTHCRFSSDRRV